MAYTDAPELEDAVEPTSGQAVNPQEFVEYVTGSDNLAGDMDDSFLGQVAMDAIADYDMDKDSMSDWFQQMEKGLELARLVREDKTYPFRGAANVKYPLVTSAALQFNARAYPAVVPADRVVKAKVWGDDPDGAKASRADRVSEHMSWQLSGPIEEWEEDTDKLLAQLPIVGTLVRKWWYDPAKQRPCCRLIEPGKFIVNEKVKSLNAAPRCTEELSLYPNEIRERINSGLFVDFEWTDGEDDQGPQEFIEQHTRLDLDEDGYTEPYVVTVHCDTRKVVKIIADFEPDDVSFETETQTQVAPTVVPGPTGEPMQVMQPQQVEIPVGIKAIRRGSYFSVFQFLPSLDGGFHGVGLGLLLGDISSTVNSTINMLLDAGKFQIMGGGFLGSEFRMRGGSRRFEPGEWKQSNASGGDIRQSIVPLPFPGPSDTLFQLLGLLIEAGREVASVKDVVTGEMPRNQTATATLATIEQGLMVFTAVFKRLFRSLKQEYRLLADMNARTVDPREYVEFHDMRVEQPQGMQPGQMQPGQQGPNPQEDYSLADMDIQPVADPGSVTKMQKAAKAQVVMELAQAGLADQGEALRRIAEAMSIEDSEDLLPKPDPAQQQMAALQMQAAQADLMMKSAEIELTLAKVEETRSAAVENIAGAQSEQMRAMNEQKKLKMEGLKALLEDDRQRISALLQSARGMAGASGNAQTQGGGSQPGGSAQGVDAASLLAGGAGVRGIPAGYANDPGMDDGLL